MMTRALRLKLFRYYYCMIAVTALASYSSAALAYRHSEFSAHQSPSLQATSPLAPLPSHLLAQANKEISRSQAASAAQRRYGGKVLSVNRSGNNFRVKLLQNTGKVVIVSVDARNGKVSRR